MDREKVIKGLETIKQFFGYGLPSTAEMFDSYYGTLNDALALLKEQQQEIWELQDQVEYLTDKLREQEETIYKLQKELNYWQNNKGRSVKWE